MTGQAAGTAGDGGLQEWGRHKGGARREDPFPVGPHGNRVPKAAVQEVGLPVKAKEEGAIETPPAQEALHSRQRGQLVGTSSRDLGSSPVPPQLGSSRRVIRAQLPPQFREPAGMGGLEVGEGVLNWRSDGPPGRSPSFLTTWACISDSWLAVVVVAGGEGERGAGRAISRCQRPSKSRCAAGCGPMQTPCPDGRPASLLGGQGHSVRAL